MKVCVFTLGSRGDVQPYVALGQALIKSGHEAVICTGGSFRAFIEEHGVSFVETDSDLMALAQTSAGKAVLEHPILHFRQAMELSQNVINPSYRKTLDTFFAAAADADCIIYHPKALGAVDIALYYDIPCVSMPPVPITWPITEFPNLALTTRNLGPTLNRMSYQINAKAEYSQISLINDFREKTLHQKPRKAGVYAFHDGIHEIPVVYPVSPALFPDVNSWNGHVFLPGFFFLEKTGEALPEKCKSFIAAGEKPVAVTFSSIPLANPERFLANLRSALERTDNRAVLLTGNSGMECEGDDRICVFKAVSHQLLFSCVKGVIHHGGVGTMAAALRAGIPQLIMPFSVDQPFWAARLQYLEMGIHSLREKEASAEKLVASLREMENTRYMEKASAFSQIIRVENGTEAAVRYIEALGE